MRRTAAAVLFLIFSAAAASAEFRIDADFPGGNIKVDRIDGDTVHLRQDLRDTEGDWFYWAFRVTGAQGRTLRFQFASDKFTVLGPAVSTDAGASWKWMGRDAVKNRTFTYAFDANAADVRFSMGMPYTESNLRAFLKSHAHNPALKAEVLCKSKRGRDVELLRFGKLEGEPRFRVLLTARHHACEMMASYLLEGAVQAVLADDESAKWLRENVEFRAVPFMDKDGVEDGDQGKNRRPHDHNRDYAGEPIYASVAALKKMAAGWSGGNLKVLIDLHCPTLRGTENEVIHFVGGPEADFWHRATRLSKLLEDQSVNGPLIFRERDNLPFGKSWNTAKNGLGRSFASWARTVPGAEIGTTIEIPYAVAGGQEVNADSARSLGRALAAAIRLYLQQQ